jgi:hypothetical protein
MVLWKVLLLIVALTLAEVYLLFRYPQAAIRIVVTLGLHHG